MRPHYYWWVVFVIMLLSLVAVTVTRSRPLADPDVFWCERLRQARASYSCDWADSEIPVRAIDYWNAGYGVERAMELAIKETKRKEQL